MRRIIVAIAALVAAGSVYAACITNTTFTPDGRAVTCTTCCTGGVCTTNCF